jgi:hypothetical protein
MTDQEIFEWGDRAEALINNPDYILLYEHITMELAKAILATNLSEHEQRKNLYNTFNGMRDFGSRIVSMVAVKQQLIEAQEAEANLNEEDRD